MKYISDDIWARLPMADFRPRFFVEAFCEKLGMNTPHFSQSRLMNIFSSCGEMLIYIDEYQTNEKNGAYLLSALDEIDSCLSYDPIAESLFSYMDEPRQTIFKRIRKGEMNAIQFNRLSLICRTFLSKEEEYSRKLLESLNESILGQTDLSQKERLTSSIYSLTGLYITYLLNRGYSPTYLYNRAELFTRYANYSGRTFQAQFEVVTERLRSHTTSYDVYFAFRSNKPHVLRSIEDDPDFNFSSNIPACIQGKDLEMLKKEFEPNVIAKATIDATDYVSASWRIKDRLDKLLDAVTALELNPRIEVSSHCVTITRNQNMVHTRTLNIDLLIGFLASEGGTYFSNSSTSIRDTLKVLDEQGKEHLGRSLRYLRLARESVSLEQKLLNLWISLESLFSDGDSAILTNIVEYVPQIYALSGLERRVCYLKDLLVHASVPATPLVRAQGIDRFDKRVTKNQIFSLLKNELATIELFNSLGEKEHLKFKLLNTFKELKDNSAISDRLKHSESDVTRQLRRIYFLRNKIAHTGHYANIKPQLITHLLDYVAVSYMAIATSATKATHVGLYSIGDLLAAYKMGSDVVVSRAKSQTPIVSVEQLIPSPVI